MKKRHRMISLITGLLCAALLVSCQQSPGTETEGISTGKDINYLSDPKFDTEEALPQYDHDNGWSHRFGGNSNCATNDTLYFSLFNEYIGYVDLDTGINGPLCGKPECSHDSTTCNSYTANSIGLSIYDTKLYWVDDDTVCAMDLDGTNRIAVCSLDGSQFRRVKINRTIAFHRGYAIISGGTSEVLEGKARYGLLVYAVSLSTGEETTIIDQYFESDTSPDVTFVTYRNMLYLVFIDFADGQKQLNISTWDLKTHETALLYSQKTTMSLREAWPASDGLLLSFMDNGFAYKFDFANHELNLLFDFCGGEDLLYSPGFANGYMIGWTLTEARVPHMCITNLEGETIYSEDLDLPDWPSYGYGYTLLGADNDNIYVLLRLRVPDGGRTWDRRLLAQIPLDDTGSVRTLWSLDREIG